jgi:hypothetical protein
MQYLMPSSTVHVTLNDWENYKFFNGIIQEMPQDHSNTTTFHRTRDRQRNSRKDTPNKYCR